jgi:hypothetical protein
VASDADRDKLAQDYIKAAHKAPSDRSLAASCGIDRETVKRWRVADSWELRRAEFWQRATNASTSAAIAAKVAGEVLTAIRRREILREIAEDSKANIHARVAALALDAKLDPTQPLDDDADRVHIHAGKPSA